MIRQTHLWRWIILGTIILTGLVLIMWPKQVVYGLTYSAPYAESLDLNPVDSFETILRAIPFKFVRLPIYWDRVEALNNIWDFSETDQLIKIAENNHVEVILAIGQKVPRWPECYAPDWADHLQKNEWSNEFLANIEQIAVHYANDSRIIRFQIENEAFFPFGQCTIYPELIQKETDIIKKHNPNAIIQTTVSGEQGIGVAKVWQANVIGLSLYRQVVSPPIGRLIFPHPSWFYRIQGLMVQLFGGRAVISELQAEPWGVHDFDLTQGAQVQAAYDAFNADDLQEYLRMAKSTGLGEISLWGPEWWLAMANHGRPELWQAAQKLIK